MRVVHSSSSSFLEKRLLNAMVDSCDCVGRGENWESGSECGDGLKFGECVEWEMTSTSRVGRGVIQHAYIQCKSLQRTSASCHCTPSQGSSRSFLRFAMSSRRIVDSPPRSSDWSPARRRTAVVTSLAVDAVVFAFLGFLARGERGGYDNGLR